MPHYAHTVQLPRRPWARVFLVGFLVVALLWTQGLGLWHRQVHSGITQGSQANQKSLPSATLGKLFANHQTDSDCRLFDQLSHAHGATALLAMASAVLALPEILRASHGLAVARWHALFQARGPPHLR